jgi:hypothetical protein
MGTNYEISVNDSEKQQPIFGTEAIELISRVESWQEIKVPNKLRSPYPPVQVSCDFRLHSNTDKYGPINMGGSDLFSPALRQKNHRGICPRCIHRHAVATWTRV